MAKKAKRDPQPDLGSIQFANARRDANRTALNGFTGMPHKKAEKRKAFLTAMMLIAPLLDQETRDILVGLGATALDRPGREDVQEAVRQLKRIGWKFEDES